MFIKQTIVIIGTGVTGKAIAICLAGGNFRLLLCDKELSKAEALVKELKAADKDNDVEAMQCSFECAWEADIIILAMHFELQKEVAVYIREVVNQKIVISMVYPVEPAQAGLSATSKGCGDLQQLLPNTKLVEIFSGDPASHPFFLSGNSTGLLISGIDNEAVKMISGMLKTLGVNTTRVDNLSVPSRIYNDYEY